MTIRYGDGNQLPINIRPMQEDDLEQVIAIDRISFSMPWSPRAYRYELKENAASLLWVAEIASKQGQRQIVGYIVIWLICTPAPEEAHIATIAVHPGYRNQGVAQELLQTALITAIQKGVGSATLEVRESNLAAQNLYERFKFEVVGHRPRYYCDNKENAILMTVEGLGQAYLDWLDNTCWRQSSHPSNSATGLGFLRE